MEYDSEPVLSAESSPDKLRNGLVWYAAVLPGLGLFLERFTLNKYLGFLLWGLILIIRPLCCLADIRMLEKRGDMTCSRWFALVPAVYLFKRCMKLRQNMAIAVVCLICLGYGIVGNGFTGGLFVDDDRIMNAVRSESPASISEIKKENVSGAIEDSLDSSLGSPQWEVTSDGDVRTVAVSGVMKDSGEQIRLEFKVTHDGYAYTDFKLDKVIKDSVILEDDERVELLKKLFVNENDS